MTERIDPAGGPDPGVDWRESDLPVEEVRALFVTLGKAFRAHQLYDQNNPVRQRFVETLRGDFDRLWTQLKEHPTEGMLLLFHMHGFADVPYRQMLIAYEHHMKVDLTGYPATRRERQPTLFARIVAVADAFDAGTSVRSYQYQPWSPDEVLREMRDNPKRGFDPLLVKVLITATGVYPVGTLVILDTHEMAIVSKVNHDANLLHRPTVRVISDAVGLPLPEPKTIDLAQVDPVTGAPIHHIIKTTDPQKYGIRVSDYLLS